MNDLPGVMGVLWQLAIPLVPVFFMAWDALVNTTYLAASINAVAWVFLYYSLIWPHSTLVSGLSRHVNYFGTLPPLLLAAALFELGLYLSVFGHRHGFVLIIASPVIAHLSSTKPTAMDDYESSHRQPDTAEPSNEPATTENIIHPKISAYFRRILSLVTSVLLGSIMGFVVSQFLVSIAVNSIVTRPIFIDDARLFGPEILLEVNITDVAVAINETESKPMITTPVNTIPDFITVFGRPTHAVPTPAPVSKSTWAPAASSTTMPTPEPTPSRIPEPEPEPEPEQLLEPEPEPEQWIKPDEVFPVFQHIINEYISKAKTVKMWWLQLATETQYTVVAIAGAVAWALLPVLLQVAATSTLTAVASYISSLLFPILQEHGYTRDQSVLLCMSLAVDITAIAAYTLWTLTRRAQKSRINATVDTSYPSYQQPAHTGHPDSSADQQLIFIPHPEQPEVDEHVRMYIEGLVRQHTANLLQDAQLHVMITNAVLLAMQGPQMMPMQAAAWQSINQHMWFPLVQLVHDKVTTCFREQQEQQAHSDNSAHPTDAPSEGSSTGQRASADSPDDTDSLEAPLGTRDDDASPIPPDDATEAISGTGGAGALLLEDNAPGAPSGEGDDLLADNATVASSREGGAQGLDLDGDKNNTDDADTTSDNGNAVRPLADLDYLGDDGRILGEYFCRMFARLLNGDYPPPKKTRRSLKPSQKRARDAAKAQEEAQGQQDDQVHHDEQPQQQASPEQDAQPEQESSSEQQPSTDKQNQPENEPEQQPSPEQEHDQSQQDDQPEQHALPEHDDHPENQASIEQDTSSEQDVSPKQAQPEQQASPEPCNQSQPDDQPEHQASSEQDGEQQPQPVQDASPEKDVQPEQQVEPEKHDQPEQDGADSPPSTGDDVNDKNHVPEPEPANPAATSENESKDSSSDEQGGENKDTPIPTKQEQPSSSGGDQANVTIDDGEVRTNPTVDTQDGDNKDTPIPSTPIKKGLTASRFADDNHEQPSTSGNTDADVDIDNDKVSTNPTVDNQGGDNNDTPAPITPTKKGLAASRFADDNDQRPSSTNGSNGSKVSSNPTAGRLSGDNKDTPLATTPVRTPVKKAGLAGSRFAPESYNDAPVSIPPVKDDLWASRFASKQSPTSGTNGNVANHTGGKAPSTPTVNGQNGDNNETPLPTPPAKKAGLAASRFADDSYTSTSISPVKDDLWASRFGNKQPSPSSGDNTSANRNLTGDSQDGDHSVAPVPTSPVKKGLSASRFAGTQPPTSSSNENGINHPRGSSNNARIPNTTSTNGGQTRDNKNTPAATPPVKKGLLASRFADEQPSPTSNHNVGSQDGQAKLTPPPASPAGHGLGTSRWADQEPSASGSNNGRNNTGGKPVVGMGGSMWANKQPDTSGSQPRRNPPPAAHTPTGPRHNPGLGGSQHNTGRPPHNGFSNNRPSSPQGGIQAAGDDHSCRTPSLSPAQQPPPSPTPTSSSAGYPHELRQDLSSTERLLQTSKYWHECLLDHRIVGKPDGRINSWYRTGNNRIERENALIEKGERTGPKKELLVPPFKFPENPEAAYQNPQPKPTTSSWDFPRPNYPIFEDTAGDTTSPPSPPSSGLNSPTQQPSPTPTALSEGRPKCPAGLHQDLSSIERLRQTSKYWHKCLPAPELVDQPDGRINQYYRTEKNRIKRWNEDQERDGKPGRKELPVEPFKFPGDQYAAYRVPQPMPASSFRDFAIFNHRPRAAGAAAGNANKKENNNNNNRRNNGNNKWE